MSWWIALFVCVAIAGCIGFGLGRECGDVSGFNRGYSDGGKANDNWWRDFAVRKGHAEFYLDDGHARQWRWLPAEKDSPTP